MTSTTALLGLAALSLSGAACAPAIAPPPVAAPPTVTLVDPRIGTGGFGFGYGGAFHGAALPHGLAKAGPDTTGDFGEVRFVHTSGNWARDQTVLCFSHVHLHGAGLPEGGVVAMMPTTSFDPARVSVRDYAATRSNEVAAAGHYRVHLDEPDIDVDLASTVHGTSWQLTFPDDTDHAVVVVDLDKTIVEGEVTSREHTVLGRRIVGRLHTDGGLSPPGGYEVFFIIEGDDGLVAVETSAGLALDFGPRDRDHPVRLKVALSLTDAAGAVANFDAELADAGSHADVVVTATAAWDAVLGRVRRFGGSDDEQVILASALYRSFLMPTVIADVDGRWRGPDGLHDDDDFRMMSDFSLWDTYRSVHPPSRSRPGRWRWAMVPNGRWPAATPASWWAARARWCSATRSPAASLTASTSTPTSAPPTGCCEQPRSTRPSPRRAAVVAPTPSPLTPPAATCPRRHGGRRRRRLSTPSPTRGWPSSPAPWATTTPRPG